MSLMRAQQYEILDSLPANLTTMKIPKYPISIGELFRWNKWQALGWIRFYYITALIFICLISFITFISFLFYGIWGFAFSFLILPIIVIVCVGGLRVSTEVLLAVLILPHQLFALHQEIKKLNLTVQQAPNLPVQYPIAIPQQQPQQASNMHFQSVVSEPVPQYAEAEPSHVIRSTI